MEMVVSVIVPVYNVFPWLREAVDSLLCQTYSPLEIILVDDGSTDGSGAVCDEYAHRWPDRIRVFHQDNRGLSGARNTGLDSMRGDVVAFLDPDDAFHPEMIRKTLAAMQRHQAEIAACGYGVYRTKNAMQGARAKKVPFPETEERLSTREALAQLIEGRINPAVWNKLYARKIWENLRFPEGRVYEDVSTTYQAISQAEKIATIPDALVMHRTRSGSITQTRSLQYVLDWMTAMEEYETFVRKNVPALFERHQLQRVQEARLRGTIAHWTRIPASDRRAAEPIRQKILQMGNLLPRGKGTIRTRIAYRMIRYCPWLIPLILPVYRPLRNLVWKVTGR